VTQFNQLFYDVINQTVCNKPNLFSAALSSDRYQPYIKYVDEIENSLFRDNPTLFTMEQYKNLFGNMNDSMNKALLSLCIKNGSFANQKPYTKAISRNDFVHNLRRQKCPFDFDSFRLCYETEGIGLQAKRNIHQGDVVFKETPFACAPGKGKDKLYCSRCPTKMSPPKELCSTCEKDKMVVMEERFIRQEMVKLYENPLYDIMNVKLIYQVGFNQRVTSFKGDTHEINFILDY
jgi:hypothetical protein